MGAMKRLYTKRDSGAYMTMEERRIIANHNERTRELRERERLEKEAKEAKK